MSENNSLVTKSNFKLEPGVPPEQKLSGPEINQIADFQKVPVQKLTAFVDTAIVIDGTKEYSTTKVIDGATHTITASDVDGTPNVLSAEHRQGNNLKVRYQFDVDCTLTLTNFNTAGNNTGIITPIAAGTYDLILYAKARGVTLEILQNAVNDIFQNTKPFDKVYYAYSGGNDGTAEVNNPQLPYALASTASVAAKAEKDANGTNVLVYIISGGAIYDNEINQYDIPIFAEDQSVVWTDVANRSVISDRHIGTAIINITGKGTFVHSSPDPSVNQQAINAQNAGTTSSIQADLIDSVQLSGSFLPTLNLYDCKVLVGLTPANVANADIIYERCILKYGILSTNYKTSNSNITYLNCFGICENIYDTEIYDKEGNLITTVDVSNLIADRLADAYAWRCPVVGASGNGNVTVAGVQYAITFNSSEEQTVDDFVDTHEAALLAVADQVILKRWKEITLTGTSGTATITLAGTPYLATFNTDLETTAADFITTHGAAINKVVQFGGVLAFSKTTEASFTLTIANASGDLNGTISYQFYLRALYDNDIVVSYAQSVSDLTVTFVDYFTLTELENRIATNVNGEYGYSGLYFQHSSSQVGADARGAKVTILDSTILLRKSKSIGAKIIFREDEINGRYGGVILRNFRIFLDGGSNNTAMIWGKDDSLVTPKELDLFSFQHQCANGPREITASGYSEPVIRSNDPSIDNYKEVNEEPTLFKGAATANATAADTIKAFTATPIFDLKLKGNDHQMDVEGNVSAFTTTGEVGSGKYSVYLINDATVGWAVAAPVGDGSIAWTADPTSETHTTAANAINLYQFYTLPDGSKYYNIHIVKS